MTQISQIENDRDRCFIGLADIASCLCPSVSSAKSADTLNRTLRWVALVSLFSLLLSIPARRAACQTARQTPLPKVDDRAPATPPRNAQPDTRAPFGALSREQQESLDLALAEWERRSGGIKSLKCNFTLWEYDGVFGDPAKPKRREGELRYKAPDKGLYRVVDETQGEHWVCDGEAIYEFDYEKKELVERPLPPELRGKAISDGPLPFLFGANADKLKQRYFLRLIAAPPGQEDKLCLEAFPRYQQDAANFRRAVLMLTQPDLDPFALQIEMANGKDRTVHQFSEPSINAMQFLPGDFSKPRVPFGWKKRIEDASPLPPDDGQRTAVVPPPSAPQRAPGRPNRR